MRPRIAQVAALAAAVAAAVVAAGGWPASAAGPAASPAAGLQRGRPEIQSMSRLAFAPAGVLLVGDSAGSAVWALDLEDAVANPGRETLDVEGLDRKVAALLGTTADEVLIHDMAVNPVSHNVYLSVSRGLQKTHRLFPVPNDAADARVLLRVTPKGELQEVPLADVRHARAPLPDPPKPDAKLWEFKSRSLTVTDLAYADGKVYVAGLSNEEFASTFRVLSYPFGEKVAATTLEIYHAAHGKYETEAPIEAFLPYRLNGKPTLLAAYTCTPLATFPMEALKPGAHVRGTTVGEFGSGNFPLDMITYRKGDKEYILLANSHRALMRLDPAAIEKQTAGLVQPVDAYATAGVPFIATPLVGVQQLDAWNDEHALVIHRSIRDGKLNLKAVPFERL